MIRRPTQPRKGQHSIVARLILVFVAVSTLLWFTSLMYAGGEPKVPHADHYEVPPQNDIPANAEGPEFVIELKAPPHRRAPRPPFHVNPKVYMTVFHPYHATEYEYEIEMRPDWSPLAVERFLELCDQRYFDGAPAFRVIPQFIVQFGIPATPRKGVKALPDDPPNVHSNLRGTLSFARPASSQVFINLRDNSGLDAKGFTPFALLRGHSGGTVPKNRTLEVIGALQALGENGGAAGGPDSFYFWSGYGESAPKGKGPTQRDLRVRGFDEMMKSQYPLMSIITATNVVIPKQPDVAEELDLRLQ